MRKPLAYYPVFFLLFSSVYLLVFHTPLLSGQIVLFYRGIELLFLVSVVGLAVGAAISFKTKYIRLETAVAAVIMSASIHLALFVVFPVTFDRSVTMYLLNSLKTPQTSTCSGLSKTNLESTFIQGYVKDQDAVGRRIKEQAVTDFVRQNGQCVTLTNKGIQFLKFSEAVKRIYGIE